MFKSRMASPIPIGEGFSPATWMSASGAIICEHKIREASRSLLPDLQGRLHTVTAVRGATGDLPGPLSACERFARRRVWSTGLLACCEDACAQCLCVSGLHSGVATAVCTMGFHTCEYSEVAIGVRLLGNANGTGCGYQYCARACTPVTWPRSLCVQVGSRLVVAHGLDDHLK